MTAIPGDAGLTLANTTNVYGNDVTLRNTYVQGGARKSWVMHQRPLTAGRLDRFYVYAHAVDTSRVVDDAVPLMLQIWRPVNTGSDGLFRLVFERTLNVNHSTSTGVYYTVSNLFVYQVNNGWVTQLDFFLSNYCMFFFCNWLND